MKFVEINKRFTEKVMEYLNKGWIINTSSLSGHQGEIGKVDVTDGKQIIRILLERKCGYRVDSIVLTVGRSTEDVIPNKDDNWSTIWNSRLDIISQEIFYQIGERDSDWYGTLEEKSRVQEVRNTRYRNSNKGYGRVDITNNRTIKTVSTFLRRKGFATINPSRVHVYLNKENPRYSVEYTYYGKTNLFYLK